MRFAKRSSPPDEGLRPEQLTATMSISESNKPLAFSELASQTAAQPQQHGRGRTLLSGEIGWATAWTGVCLDVRTAFWTVVRSTAASAIAARRLEALAAFLHQFALWGRDSERNSWWAKRSEDADLQVLVSLRTEMPAERDAIPAKWDAQHGERAPLAA